MPFIGIKCGLKGTDGDIEIPKKAGSIVFLFWKKGNLSIDDRYQNIQVFKIKGRQTSEIGGNIANALLFQAKQESAVLVFIFLHWPLKLITFEISYRLYALLACRGQNQLQKWLNAEVNALSKVKPWKLIIISSALRSFCLIIYLPVFL